MKLSDLFEMATPRPQHLAAVYYHGTPTETAARGILANGIDPAHTELKYAGNEKSIAKPQPNRIYITRDLSYAMVYAIGGNLAGSDVSRDIPKYGQYCFLFEIPGQHLLDIVPDEDSIGEMLCQWWNPDYYRRHHPRLWERDAEVKIMHELSALARRKLTDAQQRRVQDGEYEYWIKAGKRLLPLLTDDQLLRIIDVGAHVAHQGVLHPSKCWRLDRDDVKHLKGDGSNFFDYAAE
jgi:hypothetical protein